MIQNIFNIIINLSFIVTLSCCSHNKYLEPVNEEVTFVTCTTRTFVPPETKIEILSLLTPTFDTSIIQPQLLISEDSQISKIGYPEIARRAGIKGIVIVEFIVDSLGNTDNLKIIKGIWDGCDEAVLNAFRSIKFDPATCSEGRVNSRMRASINFKLSRTFLKR